MEEAVFESLILNYEDALRKMVVSALVKARHEEQLPPASSDVKKARENLSRFTWGIRRYIMSLSPTGTARTIHYAEDVEVKIGDHESRGNIVRLISFIEEGNGNINNRDYGYLPRHAGSPFHYRGNRLFTDKGERPIVFRDYMLEEWNIHHYHVDVGHGKSLLFVVYHENEAYVIDLKESHHDEDGVLFNHDPEILRMASDNFPQVVEPMTLVGIETKIDLSPGQLENLRKNNISVLVNTTAGSVVSMSPVSTSGQPVHVTMTVDRVIQGFRWIAERMLPGEPLRIQVEESLGPSPWDIGFVIKLFSRGDPMPTSVLFRKDENIHMISLR